MEGVIIGASARLISIPIRRLRKAETDRVPRPPVFATNRLGGDRAKLTAARHRSLRRNAPTLGWPSRPARSVIPRSACRMPESYTYTFGAFTWRFRRGRDGVLGGTVAHWGPAARARSSSQYGHQHTLAGEGILHSSGKPERLLKLRRI